MLVAALWVGSLYASVLGARFLFLRRGDERVLGVGMLLAAVGWMLLRSGTELGVPLIVTLPEGPREVE
ncbi:MAG: hypothetical protein RJA12_346, partial [Planctomycetota bacterium]